jgi:hypothetical protein
MANIPYEIISKRHPEYKPLMQRIERQQLLYKGGYDIQKQAKLFLKKHPIETAQQYEERVRGAAYFPFISQFVDNVSAALFSDDLKMRDGMQGQTDDGYQSDDLESSTETLDPVYADFAVNCDLKNTSYHNWEKDRFTEALYQTLVYIGADFPANDTTPVSKKDEEEQGTSQPYTFTLDPHCVINWKFRDDDEQKLEWCVLEYDIPIEPSPLIEPKHQLYWNVLRMQDDVCVWDGYQSPILDITKIPQPKDLMSDQGTTPTSFKEINVQVRKLPPGLHIGNKLGPLAEEHYSRRSHLVASENKTLGSLMVVKLGPEISAPGEALPADIPNKGRGIRQDLMNKGFTVVGSDDDVKCVESLGTSHKFVSEELNHVVETMHQVVNQMALSAQTNTKALGRSGDSKQEDRHALETLLTAYARYVKDWATELYTMIANARAETIDWMPEGLDTFVEEPRQELIQELTALAPQGNVLQLLPSPTLHVKYLTRLGFNLVGDVTDDEAQTIKDELKESIMSGEHLPQTTQDQDGYNQGSGLSPSPSNGAIGQPPPSNQPPQDPNSQGQPPQQSSAPQPQDQAKPIYDRSASTAGIAKTVYDQLSQDYDTSLLDWVKAAHWEGPLQVSLQDIDQSNRPNWKAKDDDDKVNEMQEKMQENWSKPIILVNEPNASKLVLVDGRHRLLATDGLGQDTIAAFVAYVGTVGGPWDDMHDMQDQDASQIKGLVKQGDTERPKQEVSRQTA